MVFVAGPRQVGKTTMARAIPGLGDGYRNWDVAEHRQALLAGELPTSSLWVLDEVHKYHRWRNWLKGLWDGRRTGQRKLGDDTVDKSLRYLRAKYPSADAWQVSLEGSKDYVSPDGVRVAPASRLLGELV